MDTNKTARNKETPRLSKLMEYKVKNPVAFIIFNRPDLTRQVFEMIRKVQPSKLFVIADGPRNDMEKTLTDQTRAIIDSVDWDCKVYKRYSDKNLGGKWSPYQGISWVFEQVDQAIFLEDDNLPTMSFFRYCDELLERFRYNDSVFGISGANFQGPEVKHKYSYWFSSLNGLWGFATWKRSWKKIDMGLKKWPALKHTDWLDKAIPDKQIREMYKSKFDRVYHDSYEGSVGLGYAYTYSMILSNALDVRPEKNLVSNIGFGPGANNTTREEAWANFPTQELSWPLRHPPEIKSMVEWDIEVYQKMDPNLNPIKYALRNIPVLGEFLIWGKKTLKRGRWILSRAAKSLRLGSEYQFSLSDYFIFIFEELAHKKMKIKELSEESDLSRLQIKDFKFYWPTNQNRKELSGLWQEIFNHRLLNPHSYDFPGGKIRKGDLVIDAGTCEGFFTRYALKRGAKVIALEPLDILERCLKRTFATEENTGQVKIVKALLGKEKRMSGITISPEMVAMSYQDDSGQGTPVRIISLDSWLDENKPDRVDFIKMDIEGGEVDAIQGAEELITKHKPKLAIAVYHEYENAKLIKDMLLTYRPDYKIKFRGIWDYKNVKPRPYMLFAN